MRLAEPSNGGGLGWSGARDARFYVRRGALMLVIVAAHLLILWLALLLTGFTGRPQPRSRTLAVFDVSEVDTPDAPAKPAKRVQVSKIRPQLLVPTPITIDAPPAAAGSGTGQGCGMAGVLAKGISENSEAMAAVAALPRDVRSEADAVMLWNGTWLDTGSSAALSALPVVSAMTGQDPVTMLVIGSGAWRWASLLEPEVDPLAAPDVDQSEDVKRLAAAPTGN